MKAVFIDKDGTLIQNVPYNVDPAKVDFSPGAISALYDLHCLGYALYVVTNQPGIALGKFSLQDLAVLKKHIISELAAADIPLAGFLYCPHHPQGNVHPYNTYCSCRKPAPGMLLKAARTNHINLRMSWMIGDILDDIEAGTRAGCETILIDNGNETEWVYSQFRCPTYFANNLQQAALQIREYNPKIKAYNA